MMIMASTFQQFQTFFLTFSWCFSLGNFCWLFCFSFHLMLHDYYCSFIFVHCIVVSLCWRLTNYCWSLQVGFVTFFLSSILDNLTTTIIMVSLLRKLVPPSEFRKYVLKKCTMLFSCVIMTLLVLSYDKNLFTLFEFSEFFVQVVWITISLIVSLGADYYIIRKDLVIKKKKKQYHYLSCYNCILLVFSLTLGL